MLPTVTRRLETERHNGATSTWYYVEGEAGWIQYFLLTTGAKQHPIDLSVHSQKPLYEGHRKTQCGSGTCYFSTSTKLARSVAETFAKKQDPEVIWGLLENHYYRIFYG